MKKLIRGAPWLVLLTTALTAPCTALAQEGADTATKAGEQQSGLEEIIVTARKREESINDVPTPGTVLSGDQVNLRGIDTSAELVRAMPGAELQDTGAAFSANIVLRGNNARLRGSRQEAGVGFYLNGVFTGRGGGAQSPGQSLTQMDFFDLDRIETFRGPQGALFGRNSLGGSVNVLTQRPIDTFEAEARARYATNDRLELQGVVNLPASDTLAFRFGALVIEQQDGFYTNSINTDAGSRSSFEVPVGETLDTASFYGLRGSMRWEPTAAGTVDLMLQFHDSEECSTGCYRYSLNENEDPFVRTLDTPSRFTQENFQGQLSIQWDTDFGRLVSVTSYADSPSVAVDDLDQVLNQFAFNRFARVPLPLTTTVALRPDQAFVYGQNIQWRFLQDGEFKRTTQEIRLESQGLGPFSWLVGAEYLKTETSELAAQNTSCAVGPVSAVPTSCPNSPTDPYGFRLTGQAVTALNSVTATFRGFNNVEGEVDSTAAFGAVSYTPSIFDGRVTFDAEVRVARDEIGAISDPTNTVFTAGAFVESDPLTGFDLTIEETIVSPTLAVSFDLDGGGLAYLRYAEGYRPGGFNVVASTCGTGFTVNPACTLNKVPKTFDWETVRNYEIGLKGQYNNAGAGGWAVGYDAAMYFTQRDNMQENFAAVNAQGQRSSAALFVDNVDEAEQYGAEAQVTGLFRYGGGGLAILALSAGYADGEYTQVAPSVSIADPLAQTIEGNRLRFLSLWQYGANLNLTHPLTPSVKANLGLSYSGQSGAYQTVSNNPFTEDDDRDLWSLRAGVGAERWRVTVFAENLFDNAFVLTNDSDTAPGFNVVRNPPRTIGLEFSVSY